MGVPAVAEPPVAPDDLAEVDGTGWERIPVPSSWPMQGHGLPAYTNARFPFPVDPPFVPDANPVGDHRRTFELTPADLPARCCGSTASIAVGESG